MSLTTAGVLPIGLAPSVGALFPLPGEGVTVAREETGVVRAVIIMRKLMAA